MALIYIVDDDPGIRKSLAKIVERVGHAARGFGSGREALDAIEGETPDLVVTDIYMPDLDGIEFLIRLYGLEPGLPVIAVSGGGYQSGEQVLENARNLGAVAALEKPFSVSDLEAAVEEALTGRGSAEGE